jgi:hypothetical protein
MRGRDLAKNGMGWTAVAVFLLLASPGVTIAPVASADAPVSEAPAGPTCQAKAPIGANAQMAAMMEEIRRHNESAPPEQQVHMLNGRGYNYGGQSLPDLDRVIAEGRGGRSTR